MKEMNLEEYIKENKCLFEQGKLPEGHAARFERRLSSQNRFSLYYWTTGLAAMLVLALGVRLFMDSTQGSDCLFRDEEIRYVKMYYSMKISSEVEKIRGLSEGKPERELFLEEVDKILLNNVLFETEMQASLLREKTLEAMSCYYQSSLNSLEYMFLQLNEDIY